MYFEKLLIAFCGLVFAFALLFVCCWCIVSCSFFCFKYLYHRTINLDSMISVLALDERESNVCSSRESVVPSSTSQDGTSSQGNSSIKSKAPHKDGPPVYDSPPDYFSLYPPKECQSIPIQDDLHPSSQLDFDGHVQQV